MKSSSILSKLEGRGLTQEEVVFSRDMVLLQVYSRIDKKKMEPLCNSFFALDDSLFLDGFCICAFMKDITELHMVSNTLVLDVKIL